jgi:hypothetical protein
VTILKKLLLTYLLSLLPIAVYGFWEIEKTNNNFRYWIIGIWVTIAVPVLMYFIWI